MSELERIERGVERAGTRQSRRGFISRVGKALLAVAGGATVARMVEADEAEGYHLCGHTFTTGSCPHPLGSALPRVDREGFPVRPSDGRPVDNLGRVVNRKGQRVDGRGRVLRDPDGRPLPPAPRTKLCQDIVRRQYGFRTFQDSGWFRCCGGRVRKLIDCCSYNSRRINGDGAVAGYCHRGRRVFCVMYIDTNVPC